MALEQRTHRWFVSSAGRAFTLTAARSLKARPSSAHSRVSGSASSLRCDRQQVGSISGKRPSRETARRSRIPRGSGIAHLSEQRSGDRASRWTNSSRIDVIITWSCALLAFSSTSLPRPPRSAAARTRIASWIFKPLLPKSPSRRSRAGLQPQRSRSSCRGAGPHQQVHRLVRESGTSATLSTATVSRSSAERDSRRALQK